jgi:prepilin-type N-terminal cleavage/methylation domain-containing protein
MNKRNKGFTLIELLVVIAIIGILSSVVLASLNSARRKGRDARRVADIKQVQLALEMYYDTARVYPGSATWAALATALAPTYIAVLPNDPLNTGTYVYLYAGIATTATVATCDSYHLGATLEESNPTLLGTDVDGTGALTKCTGSHDDFNGNLAANCGAAAGATDYCYDVRP